MTTVVVKWSTTEQTEVGNHMKFEVTTSGLRYLDKHA